VLYDLGSEEKLLPARHERGKRFRKNGLISTVSPIGQALMGREEGDEITVKTRKERAIRNLQINHIHDLKD
jgi:transcription elongation GreA/GreB family factor